MRKAHEALSGDVLSQKDGMFIVRDVSIEATKVEMLLSVGRTDPGRWYEFDPQADVNLWRAGDSLPEPEVEKDTKKVPSVVLEALKAFEDAERADLFNDRKRMAERNAVLRMALDPEAAAWKGFYADETARILREFQQKRTKEGL